MVSIPHSYSLKYMFDEAIIVLTQKCQYLIVILLPADYLSADSECWKQKCQYLILILLLP